MRVLNSLFAVFMLFAFCSCGVNSSRHEVISIDYNLTYDLHIDGGNIIDGSGIGTFPGDVLVNGEKIVYVGKVNDQKIDAAKTIDASNKIVTPGFIDAHAHGNPLLENDDYLKSFLRQGVTTVFLGQDGSSPYATQSPTDWMAQVNSKGIGPNVATLVGHGTLRTLSGGGERDIVSPEEQTIMETLLASALQQGAYGMSTGLEYLPGRYADKDELNGLAKVVGKYDGLISSHIRSEDDDKISQSVREVIEQGKYAKVNVTHIKIVYGKTRAQGDAVLKQIRDARAEGMIVTADVYPYLASYGSMIFLYPEWAKRQSEFDEAVQNRRAEFEEFLRSKIERRNGSSAILVSKGEYAGKTLQEISNMTGKRPEQMIIDFGHSGPSTAHFIMTKETQDAFITAPDVSISSDGSPTMRHPRSYGSFPKIIEEYVLRDELISLELAIHKMTGLTAQTFGLKTRGLLKPGMAADILVIDLQNLRANTGWTDIHAVPTGIDNVIVNGKLTDTNAHSGEPVYGRTLVKTNGD